MNVAQVPDSLKAADVQQFANRAAQLQQVKPVIAYWCEYRIIQQILAKGLHNVDQAALTYTTTLMDKLETFKGENAMDPTVTDDVAGRALIEQFSLQTFARADKAMIANNVTRQTADTFRAASTFLELLSTWDGDSTSEEIHKKIRFAKFHALRIAKAIAKGEDPNETNPKPETLPALDPDDPEVQAITGIGDTSMQPSVEETADESLNAGSAPARQTSMSQPVELHADNSILPTLERPETPPKTEGVSSASNNVSPLPKEAAGFYDQKPAVSPISPDAGRTSLVGDYFPITPSALAEGHPTAPSFSGLDQNNINLPSAPPNLEPPPAPLLPQTPSAFPQPLPPPQAGPFSNFTPTMSLGAPSDSQGRPLNYVHNIGISTPAPMPTAAPISHQAAYMPNEEAVLAAQKHARWAISALNFEDVPTAIRELRAALKDLEGR